jgi:outer membrane translocation and assembly module TamA
VYTSTVIGGKVTLTQRRSQRMSWTVSLLTERDSSTVEEFALNDPELRNDLIALGLDPTTGKQEGTLSAISLDVQRSTAENLLNARRGYQLAAHVESAGRLLPGTFNYFAVAADGRHYLPVSNRLVLASRVQVGSIDDKDVAANVPFSKKYFLGGSTSIRGWGRYEVSPLSSGEPIGGNSMMAFMSELRAMLHGNLGGVVFIDGGNVWANSWDLRFNDLKYAAGVGLRYQTPVGPIRFDYGYQLNRVDGLEVNGEPQQRPWRVHFSIGQAF